MYPMKQNIFILILLILVLQGCGRNIPTLTERLNISTDLARKNALQNHIFKTKNFDIFAYKDYRECKDKLRVYIEGDGLSWITSSKISKNPTPLNPLGLKLASQDMSKCKIYLARPCQYTNDKKCSSKYWTSHRFSKDVVSSYIDTLNQLKEKNNISSFELFGYSGGGTIATLLSAKRDDVKKLVTVAGNLNHSFWTSKHKLTPLRNSLNPINFVNNLDNIKQTHLIGEKDINIDKSIFESYKSYFDNTSNIKYKIYENFTHSCCWDKEWKNILKEIE